VRYLTLEEKETDEGALSSFDAMRNADERFLQAPQ